MRACVDACLYKTTIEHVGSVTATWDTIVDKQLHDNFVSSIITVSEVLSNKVGRTVAEDSVCHRRSITAVVLDKTLGTSIIGMEFCGLSKLRIPGQRRDSHSCLKVLYRLCYGSSSFIGYYGYPAWFFISVTVEVREPRLKVRDERLWVRSEGILNLKDLFVDSWHVTGHSLSNSAAAATVVATAAIVVAAATIICDSVRVSADRRIGLLDS